MMKNVGQARLCRVLSDMQTLYPALLLSDTNTFDVSERMQALDELSATLFATQVQLRLQMLARLPALRHKVARIEG